MNRAVIKLFFIAVRVSCQEPGLTEGPGLAGGQTVLIIGEDKGSKYVKITKPPPPSWPLDPPSKERDAEEGGDGVTPADPVAVAGVADFHLQVLEDTATIRVLSLALKYVFMI